MTLDLDNPPVLDPRNEDQLTQSAKLYATQISGGLLSSTLEGDPLDVMVRSQAYVGAELLYYANKLPLAFAARFLANMTESQRSLGTPARVEVVFTLVSVRPTSFYIPQGFEVVGSSRAGSFKFYTIEELIIPPGSLTGSVIVEAASVGSAYNLDPGAINRFTTPLTFLKSVSNPTAVQGGTDLEPQQRAINRGIAKLRSPSLVSELDYETQAQEILGLGSRVRAIGLLGGDKATVEKGAVHIFCLNSDGFGANTAQLQTVLGLLTERKHLGTRLYVSPMDRVLIRCSVIAAINSDLSADEVADQLWSTFKAYLDPTSYPVGETLQIDEVSHYLRFVPGIDYIEQVRLNGDTFPVIMPNDWSVPIAHFLEMQLTTPSGGVVSLIRTNGEPMEDV